jgi:hypothetical protein
MNKFFLIALTLTFCLQAVSSFKPTTKIELETARDAWIADESIATSTYGDINTWDTSLMKGT